MTSAYAVRRFVCGGCSAKVKKRAPPGATYCSLACYRGSPARAVRRVGSTVACGWCGTSVYRCPSEAKRIAFCSVDCHNKHQGRRKAEYACKTCGGDFKLSPSVEVMRGRLPLYCSLNCRTKCPEWHRNAVIAGNLKQQHSKEPNRLEKAGAEILRAIGIAFSEQVLIAEKFCVDVALHGCKTVVQWDGDYWHGFRADGDTRPFDQRQAKRVALDRSQDAYMRACGYTVLRFWEHEVFHQQEKVRADIQSAI